MLYRKNKWEKQYYYTASGKLKSKMVKTDRVVEPEKPCLGPLFYPLPLLGINSPDDCTPRN